MSFFDINKILTKTLEYIYGNRYISSYYKKFRFSNFQITCKSEIKI